ncbi:tegument serine/threonine protein kinase [Spheniscid alphaherpesvirus 1]|uniref:Tegument serine/threonine protein kinase n=1 Tax=Spheniscid alphaherpesvirus 1 TaxID=2560777 RepID=A0A1R3TEM9_9ALPH|nr:tegument serine/threonine protein kinase [Spheniscid alphaherpesvirus 1]SCO83585.1 tegument serine/threonine protein kinase [Spheniscid alphaherpesvirus 1]
MAGRRRRTTSDEMEAGRSTSEESNSSISGEFSSNSSNYSEGASFVFVGSSNKSNPPSSKRCRSASGRVLGGRRNSSRKYKSLSRDGNTNNEWASISSRSVKMSVRPGGSRLRRPPKQPERILKAVAVKNVNSPIFDVADHMHYTVLDLGDGGTFAGSGGYGDVRIFREAGIAVKTAKDSWYRSELMMTLMASDCAIRAVSEIGSNNIVSIMAFSLISKQMVFKAYDMDMNSYHCRLSRSKKKSPGHWAALERAFLGLGRAVSFLNIGCGLTHFDIKCGNIFVNVDDTTNLTITEAVLGDFSLMLLNTNSTMFKAEFNVEIGEERPYRMRLRKNAYELDFRLVLGHCQNQPMELLLDYVNLDGLYSSSGPISYEHGLAIDMYALGQALLEVLLSTRDEARSLVVYRNPIYYYYGNSVCLDYVLDTLAYRCALYYRLFPATALTSQKGVPWDRAEVCRSRIKDSTKRLAFECHLNRYRVTHKALFASVKFPEEQTQLLELAALYCHTNPEARGATPLLWS